MSNLFLTGDKVRFIGESEANLTQNDIYSVIKVDISDSTCALRNNVGNSCWVNWRNLEKVQNGVKPETKEYALKVSLQGGNIQSSHEVTLNLKSEEEALSLFVDLLKTV